MDDLAIRLATDLDGTFEELVRRHADRLYSVALRLTGDPRDAEEVAQDGFVRAYRALRTYDAPRIRELQLRPWLTTIVLNLARNRRRRDARRLRIDRSLDADRSTSIEGPEAADGRAGSTDAADPAEHAARRDEAARWAALVRDLPPRYRIPIVLRYVDDLTIAEIAAVLGSPEGTVKTRLHRGLRLLRAAYLGSGLEQELSA
ncbi:MAG TPA: sigma-70 family RNA polymerase sigma factor [Candidatus Limnocylindrales bacterium]|nr:sigma-70 family RNA polymerase sigma factor [Candidatus Limnocylindrales bacterium]